MLCKFCKPCLSCPTLLVNVNPQSSPDGFAINSVLCIALALQVLQTALLWLPMLRVQSSWFGNQLGSMYPVCRRGIHLHWKFCTYCTICTASSAKPCPTLFAIANAQRQTLAPETSLPWWPWNSLHHAIHLLSISKHIFYFDTHLDRQVLPRWFMKWCD